MARVKKCRVCTKPFSPVSSLSVACSPACALEYGARQRARKLKKARDEYNRETKRRKAALKTRSQWVKEVQVEFNKFIRARDAAANQPCISCGKFEAEPMAGRMWDCGHFLSVGSHPELRFLEINAWREHSRCNRGAAKSKRNEKTTQQRYEENLRLRIGDKLVDWLKGPHKPLKPTIDELKWLKAHYRERARELV